MVGKAIWKATPMTPFVEGLARKWCPYQGAADHTQCEVCPRLAAAICEALEARERATWEEAAKIAENYDRPQPGIVDTGNIWRSSAARTIANMIRVRAKEEPR